MSCSDLTLQLLLIEPITQPICLRPYLVSATIMFRQLTNVPHFCFVLQVLYKRDVYVGTFFAKCEHIQNFLLADEKIVVALKQKFLNLHKV